MYKKILIINPFGIGDVLFTTPIIHTLKDAFPSIKIGYLCNRRTVSILENNPYIDFVFVYERDEFEAIRQRSFFAWLKSILAFLRQIKEEHFEVALDFSLNTQYGFFSWYAGIKKRIGYNYKKRGRFLTKGIDLSGYCQKHIVEYYTDLLKYLDVDCKYRNLELYLKQEDIKKIDEILSKKNVREEDFLVGVIPGAGKSWGKDAYLKHWPPEKFAFLLDKIVENYQAKIIIMGDFSEKEIAEAVMGKMQHKGVNLVGETTIGELAALLNKMRLVITNDGGPLHMSVAQGIKTVSIFGPVDEMVYGPYPPSNKHIVVKKDLACRPCYKNFRLNRCFNNLGCIKEIDVNEVYSAVKRLV